MPIPYYTPYQDSIPGSARFPYTAPLLFKPLKIRELELPNRIMLSPMSQYSADDGHMTMWHYAYLGGIIQRGPGLLMIEATAVSPEGRITPQCLGLWKDSQMEALKQIVDFAHSQRVKIGIQLSHAGRKASTVAPWIHRKAAATAKVGGWPDHVISVSDQPFNQFTHVPRRMTLKDIKDLKDAWAAATVRALKAGVDIVEIHAAHGYLLEGFLNPASNDRTDAYGGPFDARTRLLTELVQLTQALVPPAMPLLVRIPGSDWLEHLGSAEQVPHWDVAQAVRLARALAELGVDWIEVSSGGLDQRQKVRTEPGYQVPFASAVKKGLMEAGHKDVVVGAVGLITTGVQAQKILEEGHADTISVARGFLRNPGLVWAWAEELDVPILHTNQIGWAFGITKTRYPGMKGGH